MIEELRIQGYRSLRDVTWKPGKLNVLIGPNGGGKSNLLRSLQLLQTAAEGNLRDLIIRQGGMGAVLWDGSAREIALSATDDAHSDLTYLLIFERIGLSGDLRIGTERLTSLQVSCLDRDSDLKLGTAETLLSSARHLGSQEAIKLASQFQLFRVYHDLRVDQSAEVRQPPVSRNERHLSENGQNLAALLSSLYQRNREFEADVDRAMSAAFPDDYDKLIFPPESSGRIELMLRRKHSTHPQSAADLSDGTLRFLMLASILCHPEPPSLIAIDEPELGLHPRMLSIVAELATSASDRTQVVLSTHSEQLLNCFHDEVPTTTVVTWDGKESHLNSFSAEQLTEWLAEFSLGEFSFSGTAEALG